MGNYKSLNVLNIKQPRNYMSDDCIEDVANLLKSSGANRSQRRRLEKSLSRVETIMEHTQKRVDDSAYREYSKAVEKNYLHFFAILALTAGHDYKWREDDQHDQISSLLERVDKNIKKYANQGYTTEDLLKLVDDEYNITLVPSNDIK